MLILYSRKSTYTAGDICSKSLCINLANKLSILTDKSCLSQCLCGCCNGKLGEAVHMTRILFCHILQRIESLYLAGKLYRKILYLKGAYRSYPYPSCLYIVKAFPDRKATGIDCSKSGYNNSSSIHPILTFRRLLRSRRL